ncbi:MAG TPA: hypothetical protein PK961_16620 [bacterium]|nr:hypothetical protein [bacterium]
MYRINKSKIGNTTVFNVKLSGQINESEMQRWVSESKRELLNAPKQFVVHLDTSDLRPLDDQTLKALQEGQKLYLRSGMTRSAVLVNNPTTRGQIEHIAREAGFYEKERIFSADEPNVQKNIDQWLTGKAIKEQ